MSDLPLSPPDARSPARWPAYVSWTIIVLAVGYILAAPHIHAPKASPEKQNLQFDLSAKYVLGVRQILPTPPQQLVDSLDRSAKTPPQKLDMAILAGEMEGPDAALKRLADLQAAGDAPDLNDDIELLRRIYTQGPNDLTSSQRQHLLDEYGFFGRLTLIYKQPDSDPARQKIAAESKHTVVILFSFGGLVLLLAFAGLGLLITGVVLISTGRWKIAYVPRPAGSTVYVEMFAVYLLSFFVLGQILKWLLHGDVSLGWYWALSIELPIVLLWGWLRGLSWQQMRQDLGWHSGRGWLIELPLGLAGYVAGVPVIIAGFCVTWLLLVLSGAAPSHPIQFADTSSAWDILQMYGIACVWAPIIEETMFRGALFAHLRQRWNWPIGAGIVAFVFAAIHPQGWTFIPVLGAIAVVLAGLREWRGSILPSMVAHGCNNFIMVTLLILLK